MTYRPMTGRLYRSDHPDAPNRATEYVGTLGARTLDGEFDDARRAIALTVRDGEKYAGSALLFHWYQGRYVGEITIGDAVHEMVASSDGFGVRRHWVLTLHEVV